MLLYHQKFGSGQKRWLINHRFVHGEFANVMKRGGILQNFEFSDAHVDSLRQFCAQFGHLVRVIFSVRVPQINDAEKKLSEAIETHSVCLMNLVFLHHFFSRAMRF